MKFIKNGNLAKAVAFFVIAVVLTCTVSYAAGGWQLPDSNNSGNIGEGEHNPSTDETDENKDPSVQKPSEDVPVIKPIPEYLHYLTGEEISLEQSYKKPLCFSISSDEPAYGLSSSFIVVEIPIEEGNSRFLCFTDDALSLGKIGSIAPTRSYITSIASYFGGLLISNGTDEKISPSYDSTTNTLSLTDYTGYHYTEYGELIYTNQDLIAALIKNSGANTVKSGTESVPYNFTGYYDTPISGVNDATSIIINYSSTNNTEFKYEESAKKYLLSKNGAVKNDLLNDKTCEYDNIFILYSDSTTYETLEYTQTVLNTSAGGKGIYITNGKSTEISWTVTKDGNLLFLNHEAEKLSVNRGKSYISFVKSSMTGDVVIK